jgi:hypothetical protein
MAINPLSTLVDNENLLIERRIKKYDVSWGKPFGAMDYHGFVISGNPRAYWTLDSVNGGTNLGTEGTEAVVYGDEPTSAPSITKLPTLGGVWTGQRTAVRAGNMQVSAGVDSYYDFGLSLVIKPNLTPESKQVTTPNQYEVLVTKGGFDTPTEFLLILSSNNKVYLYVGGSAAWTLQSSTVLQPNQVYHIGVSVNSHPAVRKHELYINGVLESEYTGSQTATVSQVSVPFSIGGYTRENGTVYGQHQYGYVPFSGQIEAVAVYDYAPSGGVFKQQSELVSTGSYYLPYDSVDTASVDLVTTSNTYRERVLRSEPRHYYTFDEEAGQTIAVDAGSGSINGNYVAGAKDTVVRGPIARDDEATGKARKFSFNDNFVSMSPLSLDAEPAGRVAACFEFWMAKVANSSQPEGFLSFTDSNKQSGVAFRVVGNKGLSKVLVTKLSNTGTWEVASDFVVPNAVPAELTGFNANAWKYYVHVAVNLGSDGGMSLYINGNPVAFRSSDGSGMRYPVDLATARLRVDDYYGGSSSSVYVDQLAVYNRTLTDQEIRDHFLAGRYGKDYATRTSGSTNVDNITGYTVNANELTELINEEDISKYVSEYSVDRDMTQFIDAGHLVCHEEWKYKTLRTKLQANTYVVIQERYRSMDYTYDSGWVDLGHFLVEGPMGYELDARGHKVYQVALKGVMKVSQFPIAHNFELKADKLPVDNATLVRTALVEDVMEFQVPRPENSNQYYQNWAESPTPRLVAKNFLNRLKPDSVDSYKEDELNQTRGIRVKSAEGAIQVLGGRGVVRVDREYYEDRVPDGLGNPNLADGMVISFDRYIGREDIIDDAVIQNIAVKDGN